MNEFKSFLKENRPVLAFYLPLLLNDVFMKNNRQHKCLVSTIDGRQKFIWANA